MTSGLRKLDLGGKITSSLSQNAPGKGLAVANGIGGSTPS
jgi:hypothetical protein